MLNLQRLVLGSRHARENISQRRELDCHLNRDWAGPLLLLPSSEVEIVTVNSIKSTKKIIWFP